MLVFQGAVAVGSATWGALAESIGLDGALLWAGVGIILTRALTVFLPLPAVSADLTPWNHWRVPVVASDYELEGPVLVAVEYDVLPERVQGYIEALREFGRIRQRDGTSHRGGCRDLEMPHRYVGDVHREFLGGTPSPA